MNTCKNRVFRRKTKDGTPIGPWMLCTKSTKYTVEGFATFEQIHPLYEHHNMYLVQKKNCYFPEMANVQVEQSVLKRIISSSLTPTTLRLHINKKNTKLLEKEYEVLRLYSNCSTIVILQVQDLCICEDYETHEKYIRIVFGNKIYEQE